MKKPITVVGIPARNEETTVSEVALAADAGLSRFFPDGKNVVILAENGSTDETVKAFESTNLESHKKVVSTDGNTGKGTNVFAIIEKALEWDADRVLLLDADVRSVKPSWVDSLASAVEDQENPIMGVPVYQRNRFEANTTNHLASPLLAATLGRYIQQPIGGEFAFNRAFMERVNKWHRPASAQFYGVDIWLTANALRENAQVFDVPLGRKIHTPPFAKVLRMPQQVLDALFHVVLTTGEPRGLDLPFANKNGVDDGVGVRPSDDLVMQATNAVERYIDTHWAELAEVFPSAKQCTAVSWGLKITTKQWPYVLADALTALASGAQLQIVRDHLISLYVQRIFSWWEEISDLDNIQTGELVIQQAQATALEVQRRRLTWPSSGISDAFHVGNWEGYGIRASKEGA